jgi:hypothetical protein
MGKLAEQAPVEHGVTEAVVQLQEQLPNAQALVLYRIFQVHHLNMVVAEMETTM